MTSVDKPNCQQLQHGIYLVRTQAGFRQALKLYCEGEKLDVVGFPQAYPALVLLYIGYNGTNYVGVRTVHVNQLTKILQDA
jgi:hypothetical protein